MCLPHFPFVNNIYPTTPIMMSAGVSILSVGFTEKRLFVLPELLGVFVNCPLLYDGIEVLLFPNHVVGLSHVPICENIHPGFPQKGTFVVDIVFPQNTGLLLNSGRIKSLSDGFGVEGEDVIFLSTIGFIELYPSPVLEYPIPAVGL